MAQTIIDFHTHIFPDRIARKTIGYLAEKGSIPAFSDGKLVSLLYKMEQADVDVAVNLPVLTSPSQFDGVNRFAAELNREFARKERRIISFAGIHPRCTNIAEKMAWIAAKGFKGVKIHPDYQEIFFDDEGYLEILAAAKANDLIVVTHAGLDYGFRGCPVRCAPERSARVIEMVPHSKLVLAHYGAMEMHDEVEALLCGKDVYFDTSFVLQYIDDDDFTRILNKHGAERILFASDSPWSSIVKDVARLRELVPDGRVRKKIFSENAIKLLGI